MNNKISMGLAFVILFVVQFTGQSFNLLLSASFFVGALLYKAELTFFKIAFIELIICLLLIAINGVHFVSAEQFAQILNIKSAWLLIAVSVLVSIISVALLCRTASLLVQRLTLKKA